MKGWIDKQGGAGVEDASNLRVKGTNWRGGEDASSEGAAVALRMHIHIHSYAHRRLGIGPFDLKLGMQLL